MFDPATCCPTGVCGPEVDPALVRFAADLEWLKSSGVEVERFNLSQEPAAFVANAEVAAAMRARDDALAHVVRAAHHPVLDVVGRAAAQRDRGGLGDLRPVLGVDELEPALVPLLQVHVALRREAEDAAALVGEREAPGVEVAVPVADVREALRLREEIGRAHV